MDTADGALRMVFKGEIYNYRELRLLVTPGKYDIIFYMPLILLPPACQA